MQSVETAIILSKIRAPIVWAIDWATSASDYDIVLHIDDFHFGRFVLFHEISSFPIE